MILSRIYCPTCDTHTVHHHTHCIHCGTEHVFPEEPMNEAKWNRLLGQKRRSRRGAEMKNRGLG
jgi:ribosomal protein L44E